MQISQRTKIAVPVAAAVAVLVGAGVWLWAPRQTPPPPPPPPSRPVSVPARPPPAPEPQVERKVIARVGELELTNFELARYQKFREVSAGAMRGPQAQSELCERALLDLLAAEHHLELTPVQVEHELLRRKMIIGATSPALRAQAAPSDTSAANPTMAQTGVPPGRGAVPASVLDNGEQLLSSTGLSPAEIEAEVKADALAQLAKQALIYDRIPISNKQLKAAYQAERRSQVYGASPRLKRRPERQTLDRLRQRLRLEKGAEPLRALLEATKQKWKFDCSIN